MRERGKGTFFGLHPKSNIGGGFKGKGGYMFLQRAFFRSCLIFRGGLAAELQGRIDDNIFP